MPWALQFAVGRLNTVSAPPGVRRPILSAKNSVNHKLPSGPATMPIGSQPVLGCGNSVKLPAGVMRPIWATAFSANQKLPSGPRVTPRGPAPEVGTVKSVTGSENTVMFDTDPLRPLALSVAVTDCVPSVLNVRATV